MGAVEDDQRRDYLLGQLSESEVERVEEEYFADDEAFEHLSAVEDDLIDAYALHQLSRIDRRRFEERLVLSPAQRQRVRFARTMLHAVSGSHETTQRVPSLRGTAPWWASPFAFVRTLNPALSLTAAAVLILAALFGWRLIHRSSVTPTPDHQAQQVGTPSPQPGNDNTLQASQFPSPTNQSTVPDREPTIAPKQSKTVLAFTLVAGLVRDAGASNRLVIPRDVGQVRLDFSIAESDELATFRAELRKAEGGLVWPARSVRVESRTKGQVKLSLDVPSAPLKDGDFILTINKAAKNGSPETVADYTFRVVRK